MHSWRGNRRGAGCHPVSQAFYRVRDLKLDRSTYLLLDDCSSGPDIGPRTNIVYSQLDKVTRSKLAIDCQIKDREVAP